MSSYFFFILIMPSCSRFQGALVLGQTLPSVGRFQGAPWPRSNGAQSPPRPRVHPASSGVGHRVLQRGATPSVQRFQETLDLGWALAGSHWKTITDLPPDGAWFTC